MISNETVITYDDVFENHPGVVLGYRENGMPIYNIAGGSVDVTDDDVVDSDDEDDETDTSDTSETDWTPPTREDFEKLLAAKSKADSEAAQRKRWLRENGFDPKTGQPIKKPSVALGDDDEDDTDVLPKSKKKDDADADDLLRASREKLEKTFQRQLERETQKAETRGRSTAYSLISEVPAALEDAGWNGKNLPRMIKLLDLDTVEIDEDGVDADALSAQVAELKKDFPEFFKRARMKDAAKEIADTGAVGGGKKKAPASEEDLDWKARMKLQLQRPNH